MRFCSLLLTLSLLSGLPAWGQNAHIVNLGAGSLTSVDAATGAVVATTSLGGTPYTVAVGGERIYVSLPDAGNVEMIDTAAGTRASFGLGGQPTALALDPAGVRLYVTDAGADTLTALDASTGAFLGSATVAGTPLAVAADASQVYVAAYNAHTLEVLDATTLAPIGSLPVGMFPVDVAVDGASSRAWVASLFDDVVSVVDTAAPAVLTNVPVNRTPSALAVSPTRGEVYVTHVGAGIVADEVTILDAVGNTVLGTLATGLPNPVDALPSPTGDRLFVSHLGDSQLVAFDLASGTLVDTVDLGPSHGALAGFTQGLPPAVDIPTVSDLGLGLLALLLTVAAGWILRRRKAAPVLTLALVGLLACLLSSRADAQDLEILDGEFLSWASSIEPPGAPGGHTAERQTAGGNPGAFWRMVHFSDSATPLSVSHRYTGGGDLYDPAARGALTAVDFSWDRFLFSLDGPTAVEEMPAVFQDGDLFVGPNLAFASPSVWEAVALPGLTAADFTRLGGSGNPDFSTGGGPIAFGFVRRTPGGFAEHRLDDFRACARSAAGGACSGGGGAGSLSFMDTTFLHVAGSPTAITVQRTGGTAGEVGVTIQSDLLFGPSCTLAWTDGDGADKTCLLDHPPLSELLVGRLRLVAASGGASFGDPSGAVLLVSPDEPPYAFFLLLLLLLSRFEVWGVLLLAGGAGGALVLARRRRGVSACPPAVGAEVVP